MPPRPELHPVQLESVRAERITAFRRDGPTETEQPTLRIPRASLRAFAEGGRSFVCTLRISLRVPVGDQETWHASVLLAGTYSSARELTQDEARYFARNAALYVMWPFARGYLDQLGMIAGIVAPPLPLIVRPDSLPTRRRA